VAPTDSVPIVRFNPKEQQRSLDILASEPLGIWRI
jgi:hypothetical protein